MGIQPDVQRVLNLSGFTNILKMFDTLAAAVANGVLEYSFEVNTRVHGKGTFRIYVRLMRGDDQLAVTSVTAKFSGR
jgi:hypothetical protein